MNEFQLTGGLPDDTLLLEASAGTGKTYTIAALAVRYIAEEGLDVGSLLMITFGNNAAAELRSRVFAALERTALLLVRWRDEGVVPDPGTDPVAHHLVGLPDPAQSLARLHRALDRFDEATILTTHAFCQHALEGLGILGDADHAEELSQADTLIDEVAADCYLGMFANEERPPFEPWECGRLARSVCESTLPLEPVDSARAAFGRAVREEFERRKRDMGLVTFNDLITRMRQVLRDDVTGPHAREWLCRRYTVVLVDEFQDTDPDQWQVIRDAFVDTGRATILIGDPKQSIYGFRSADLLSYLDAASHATKASLGTNFRSDPGIVDGVVSLMKGMHLGHEQIQVSPVAARHPERLEIGHVRERVWVRRVSTPQGTSADEVAIDDLVHHVQALLGKPLDGRRVSPDDITVLTRTGQTARRVTKRLADLGYPAVQFGGTNVWDQPAAQDWVRLLKALLPSADAAKRVVALSDLFGATVTEITSPAATRLWDILTRAGRALEDQGPGAALQLIRSETDLDARLVPTPRGERYLTDLLHIGEFLDRSGHRDALALLRVLEEAQRLENEADVRVTTDAPAVKVMTLHAAKGLEFPIVLMPDMSSTRIFLRYPFNVVLHGRRSLWVEPVDERDEVGRLALAQARDEELRLLYVGLTRAKHLAVAWHVDSPKTPTGPLSAALFRDRERNSLEASYNWRLAPSLPGVRVSDVTRRPALAPYRGGDGSPRIELRQLGRDVDQFWRRTSYTGLTTGLHDLPSGADETLELDAVEVDERLRAPAPMGDLPAGAAFGTLVHEALERLDWSPDGLTGRLESIVAELAVGFDDEQSSLLARGLEAVVRTPLLPLTGQSLTGVPVANRLPELDFDLPMADHGGATLGALAELLGEHLGPSDPLAAYPARLASSPAAGSLLRGMLTGSIDAVLATDEGRFLVVDYKTNRLAATADEPLTLGHYTPGAMAEAMMEAHYPLQAILYCAALHRFLSLRQPGYDPERHLGGVGYLFVRGMAGEETPVVDGHSCGVFAWHPSAELVVAVSSLLGGDHA
ncbi:UvrD-helicase domain-containing protein [Tessaracoccus oleiagri]|uniref:RecBCD enzyme subunit RecB n=1 Tax=Tessaracoccus oleiagri TaxID=686624 RepID=A0A1G9L993_9ACTN|nr:UvrD-helicase domain-containing protein [Tessaracoccus oleiagri]SDL58386.1 exodeoxyribonuclease V beta subunit [Tessaracoccus oleiagri]